MVNAVSAVSSTQNAVLKPSVQNGDVATATPSASASNIDYVVSGIYVNNLQNVAILEYRSLQTGEILQQYPNQAQINAFKSAERLAQQANLKQQSAPAAEIQHAAAPSPEILQTAGTTQDHVSPAPASSSISGGRTTSIVA